MMNKIDEFGIPKIKYNKEELEIELSTIYTQLIGIESNIKTIGDQVRDVGNKLPDMLSSLKELNE